MLSYVYTEYSFDKENYLLSESFSIGLTVLQAGMLFDFSYLYNLRSFKMDYDRFMDKFKEWSEMKYYSESERAYVEYSPELKTNNMMSPLPAGPSPNLKQVLRNLIIF